MAKNQIRQSGMSLRPSLLLASVCGLASVCAAQQSDSMRRWAPGEVVVIPESLEEGKRLREQFAAEGFLVLGFGPVSGLMVVSVEPGLEVPNMRYMESLAGVRAIERGVTGQFAICNGPGTPPSDDPDFDMQWHLHNTGQVITANVGGTTTTVTGTCGVDIDAIRAWQRTRGSPDVWLAVLDSGIDVDVSGNVNEEFEGRLVDEELALSFTCPELGQPWSFPPSDCCYTGSIPNFGYPFDLRNHGTYVTGTAAASHNDEVGLGVDPGCTIVPVRVDAGDSGWLAQTIIALETIEENNEPSEDYEKVRVINMSYQVGNVEDESIQIAMFLEVLEALREDDVMVVTISGNSESPTNRADYWLPSASPDVITVGGTDNQDRRCDPAVWGVGTFASGKGNSLDFAAPGFGILTTGCNSEGCECEDCDDYRCNDGVGQPAYPLSGTSGSAPIVSGIITLLLARADVLGIALDWDQVYDLLKAGAVDLGTSGHDTSYGWGRVNAYETLMELERQYYFCDADVTHTDDEAQWGYAVPDGKIDTDDYTAFSDLYTNSEPQADLTTTGYTTAGGGGLNGTPDGDITIDDYFYFLSFYANCSSLGVCPSCP